MLLTAFESVTLLDTFCWIHWVTISEFHEWSWIINPYQYPNFWKFCLHSISLQFVNHLCNLLRYFLLNLLSHTLRVASVIKNVKSVHVAQLKHILKFPYDFRKLLLNWLLINWPSIIRWLFYYSVAPKAQHMTMEVLNLKYLIHKEEG